MMFFNFFWVLNAQLLNDLERGELYHNLGVDHAEVGNYSKSLAYLRSACRINPKNHLYFNDLGVTEMRAMQFQKAKKRFLKSLQLNNTQNIAAENLKELEDFMNPSDFKVGIKPSYPQKHSISSVKQLPGNLFKLNSDHLIPISDAEYDYLSEPFIIPNAVSTWNWEMAELSLEKIIQHYGRFETDFYPQNMLEVEVHPFFTTLESAVRQLVHLDDIYDTVDVSEPGTYIQWNMPPGIWHDLLSAADAVYPAILDDADWLKQCFDDPSDLSSTFHHRTHWKMLLIAEAGAGMFNHQDTLRTASWQVQLLGSKRWHLCAPSQNRFLYRAGDVDTFQPDYDRFPLFRNASCQQVTLRPGDLLYYPPDYWHQTEALDTPTVSISGTIAPVEGFRHVRDQLRQECGGRGYIFRPEPELCGQLERCYRVWERLLRRPAARTPAPEL